MKSSKKILFSLLVIFLVIVVVQNIDFFRHEEALRLNLLVWRGETGPIPLGIYLLGLFLIGILISYFYGLGERFKTRKTIQNHLETIRKLEKEIQALKSPPVEEEKMPSRETEGG